MNCPLRGAVVAGAILARSAASVRRSTYSMLHLDDLSVVVRETA
jgi:hypothetical protein